MRIFKNAWFERLARKTKYPTNHCAKLLNRLITGLSQQTWVTALSSNVCRVGTRAFFVYAYAKNERENITATAESAFRKAAPHVLNLTDEQLAQLILQGQFTEVPNE